MRDKRQTNDPEKLIFDALIDEIIIRRKKSLSRRFTIKELEKLEVELNASRSSVQGYFRADKTKKNTVPNQEARDRLAQLDGAYKDYEDFVGKYFAQGVIDNSNNEKQNTFIDLSDMFRSVYSIHEGFQTIPILGASDAQKSFTISDLYMDISYVNRQDLKSNNDYFVIEREGASFKRNKKPRAEIFTSFFPIETVTQDLILTNEHLVLMGNPGVGKTTYAKWLCHQWAAGSLKTAKVPIYIACRELVQHIGNSIISYISSMYFDGEYDMTHKALTSAKFEFMFLLDGYDEASTEQRGLLEKDLKRFTKLGVYPSMLVLSRPYALVDSPFKRLPVCYELLGFSELNRRKYAMNFLERVGLQDKAEALIEFIDDYEILRELSYTPLYLSYIASIFVNDGGYEALQSIHSAYDLNKKALGYTLDYHVGRMSMSRSEYLTNLSEAAPFVADLELYLSFVYHSKDSLDKNFRYSEILSRLGVGRLEENKETKSWSFYVLNVHFQETLAAEYFGPILTKEALLYLLGNPIYWHFAKMLVGYLLSNNKEEIYIETITYLKNSSSGKLVHNTRLYFILLGEATPELLSILIDEGDINNLIEHYRWMYTDAQWNTVYFESISRIYRKLDATKKNHFALVVADIINHNLVIPEDSSRMYRQEEISGVSFPGFLTPIIEQLRLYQNKDLVRVLTGKYIQLEIASQEQYKWIEIKRKEESADAELLDYWAEEEIDNSRYILLVILDQVDDVEMFDSFRKILRAALETSTLYAVLVARIVAKLEPFETILSEFEGIIRKAKHTDDDIIMLSLLGVGLTTTTTYYEKRQKVNDCLRMLRPVVEKLLFKRGEKAKKNHFIARSNYALALTQTDDISLFSLLVWANSLKTTEFYVMHDLSVQECCQILDDFFISNATITSKGVSPLQELISTIMSMDIGHIILDKYYGQFFSLFENLVGNNFSEMEKSNRSVSLNRFELPSDEISTQLYNIPDILLYPSTLKRFTREIFTHSMMRNEFISERYIPFLFSCEMPLYEAEWWNFIIDKLISEVKDLSLVVNILYGNQFIYMYESNLQYITKVWKKFSEIVIRQQDETFISGAVTEIISNAYRSFELFQRLNCPPKYQSIVDSIVALLKMPLMVKYLYSEEALYHEDDIHAISIYPILADYTKDKELTLTDAFERLLESVDINRISNFFNGVTYACKATPHIYKEYLGEELYKKLERYCIVSHREDYIVSPKEFKGKLKPKDAL